MIAKMAMMHQNQKKWFLMMMEKHQDQKEWFLKIKVVIVSYYYDADG